MDDVTVAVALKSAIRGVAAPERAEQLCRQLDDQRQTVGPLEDDVWIDGLRAIHTSVCDIGDQRPGKTAYLRKARAFVAKAIARAR